MANRRRQHGHLSTAGQIGVLGSAVALEIIEALQVGGPATTAEVGLRIGRKSNSLHYHMRLLERADMVRQTAFKRSGARSARVFDVAADRFEGRTLHGSRRLRTLTAKAVAAILRHTSREFARALDRPDARDHGPDRNIAAERFKGRLTAADLARVNRHLGAIQTLFLNGSKAGKGQYVALTLVLAPAITLEKKGAER